MKLLQRLLPPLVLLAASTSCAQTWLSDIQTFDYTTNDVYLVLVGNTNLDAMLKDIDTNLWTRVTSNDFTNVTTWQLNITNAYPDIDTNATDDITTSTYKTASVNAGYGWPDLDTNSTDDLTINNIYSNFALFSSNFVSIVTQDTTITIPVSSTTITFIGDVITTNLWVADGVTLTFDFANGIHTIAQALATFDDIGGPGSVNVIGNQADNTLCTILQTTTNYPIFAIENGTVELIAGFTLKGSSSDSPGSTNIHAGIFVSKDGFAFATNCTANTLDNGYRASWNGTLWAENCTASGCQSGFFSVHGGHMSVQDSTSKLNFNAGFYCAENAEIYAISGPTATSNNNGYAAYYLGYIGVPSHAGSGNSNTYMFTDDGAGSNSLGTYGSFIRP